MFRLPSEFELITGAVVIAAALAGGAWFVSHERSIGQEREAARQTAQALAGEQESRRESDRRAVAIQQKATDADQAASAARADADAAHSAGERLRLRLAAAERSRPAVNPGPADAGAPADTPADLYADVLARTIEAARLVSDFADQSRIAGQACQQSYEALRAP